LIQAREWLLADQKTPVDASHFIRRHVQFGWWSLLSFLSLGMFLEAMHGFKVSWYIDPSFESRRLVWTLGHAHGTLLGVIHIVFAATIHIGAIGKKSPHLASGCLMAASVLLPGGFFLGGIFIYGGDPGLGILLVPVGAVCLFISVLLVAVSVTRGAAPPSKDQAKKSRKQRKPAR